MLLSIFYSMGPSGLCFDREKNQVISSEHLNVYKEVTKLQL